MFNNVLTLWLSAPSYSSNEQRCLVNTTQPLDKSLLITQTDGIVMVSGGLWWIISPPPPIWLNKLSLSQRGLSIALFLLMGLSLPSILLALYEEAMCVWLNSVLRTEKATAHSHCILWCMLSSVKLLYTAPLGCLLIFYLVAFSSLFSTKLSLASISVNKLSGDVICFPFVTLADMYLVSPSNLVFWAPKVLFLIEILFIGLHFFFFSRTTLALR